MLRAVAVVVLGLLPSYAAAQGISQATCQPGFEWMFNSANQSPCDVAADLAGVCTGGQFTLQALGVGFVYLGPSSSNANSCRCSTVYYSLLSACAVCQQREFIRWSAYNGNCSTVYSQVFQQPIPIGVKVPNYAYLDIEDADAFNATRAQAAGGVESTRLPSAPTSSPIPSGGPASGGGKKSNAGAIAGGVVGGVVGLALLGGLIFWLLRRRSKSRVAPSAEYDASYAPQPSMGYASTLTPNATGATHAKVYDPNDPTTFPIAQHTGTTYNPYSPSPDPHLQQPSPFTAPQITPNYTGPTQTVHTPTRPNYSGAPEL